MKTAITIALCIFLSPLTASAQAMMSKAAQNGNPEKLPELQQRLQQIVDMIAAKRAESATSSAASSTAPGHNDEQLKGLENAIAQLKQKLGSMMGASSTPTGLTKALGRLQCIQLHRVLRMGSRGNDVAELQRGLIARGHLEEGNDTGYFGAMTRKAVQEFQAAQGIVSSGDENTNGFGAVGPRTRALFAKCEQ